MCRRNIDPDGVKLAFLSILISLTIVGTVYSAWSDELTIQGTIHTMGDFNYPYIAAYWKFDEGYGTVAEDSSMNNNDGTIHGAEWTEGKLGHALFFDGDDDLVEIPDDPSLDLKDQLTIMAWIKPISVYSGGNWKFDDPIVCKRFAYYLVINGDGRIAFFAYGLSPGGWIVGSNMTTRVDRWTYVAVSYDGSCIKIFIDGNMDVSVPRSGCIQESDQPLRIGGHVDYNRYFHGIIDDIKIYDRALTDEEIYREYEKGL